MSATALNRNGDAVWMTTSKGGLAGGFGLGADYGADGNVGGEEFGGGGVGRGSRLRA